MPKVITPDQVYQLYVHKRTAEAVMTLRGPKLNAGEVVEVCAATIIDLDTPATLMRLGYNDGARDIWILRRRVPANAYALYLRGRMVIRAGQHLIGMIESPADKDDIYLLASGYYVSEVGV